MFFSNVCVPVCLCIQMHLFYMGACVKEYIHICVCTQHTQHTFTHKVFHISHTVTYAARFGAQKLLQDTFRLNPNHRALLVSLRRLVFLGQCVVVSSYWKNVCLLIKDTLICGQGFYSCSIFAQQNLRGA